MTAFAFVGTATRAEWADWEPTSVNVAVGDDGVRIARESTPTYVDPASVVAAADVEGGIVDVAQDDCGDLYLLAGTGDLYVSDPGGTAVRPVRCGGGDGWGEPRALCVTAGSIFVAYAGSEGGLVRVLVKELRQTRRVIDRVPKPDEQEDEDADAATLPIADPVRLVADGERTLLADAGAEGEPGRLVELGADGVARVAVAGLDDPTDLAVDDGGRRYVLLGRGAGAAVAAYDPDGSAATAPLDGSEGFETACLAVGGRDELVVGLRPDAPGDRSPLRYRPESASFERVPAFNRGCRRLVPGTALGTDRDPGLFVLDAPEAGSDGESGEFVPGVTFLRAAHRTRRNPLTGRYEAHLTAKLDSGVAGVEWHRVRVERALGGLTTGVRVASHATDAADATLDVRSGQWAEVTASDASDALLDGAVGRYLFVRLTLLGDEFDSPTVTGFRAYFPRRSYLRYLPAIYQEDEESRAFLEHYLSVFESVFTDLEEEIEHLTRYLDAAGVPTDHLAWLEGWIALETDETWPEAARRALVARAAELHRARGTRGGLLALLELYLGGHAVADVERDGPAETSAERAKRLDRVIADARLPAEAAAETREVVERGLLTVDEVAAVEARIAAEGATGAEAAALRDQLRRRAYVVEYGDLDCIDDAEARADYERLLDSPHCFLVLVRSALDEDERLAVRRLVEATRPAHAVGRVVPLQPAILLGGHAYLGINSVLSDGELVVSRSGLGRDSALGDRVPHAQLEVRSRLDDDARLA